MKRRYARCLVLLMFPNLDETVGGEGKEEISKGMVIDANDFR